MLFCMRLPCPYLNSILVCKNLKIDELMMEMKLTWTSRNEIITSTGMRKF